MLEGLQFSAQLNRVGNDREGEKKGRFGGDDEEETPTVR